MRYIPEKIEVKITKTNRISFVTYRNLKGVLKKPQTYKNFGDGCTTTEETFVNETLTGFKIVDFNGFYDSYKFTSVKVEDPRGFQIEVTVQNLIGLLGTSDYKGKFVNPIVYSWRNGWRVLLDSTTEEYKTAEEYSCITRTPTTKVALAPGYVYQGAQGGKYLFLGVLPYLSLQSITFSGEETTQNLKSKTAKVFKIIGKAEAPFTSPYYDRSFTISPERLIGPLHNEEEHDYDRILQSYKDSKYYGTKMEISYELMPTKMSLNGYVVQVVLHKGILLVAYPILLDTTLASNLVLHPTGCIEKIEVINALESSPDTSYVIAYYNTDLNPLKRPYLEFL